MNIRPFVPTDINALYDICLRTGDSGRDASRLYQNPHLLGDVYAAPYAMLEPGYCFVLAADGNLPVGYVLGTPDTGNFGRRCELEWFPKLRRKLSMPAADDTSPDAAITRIILRGLTTENSYSEFPAHLHIDLLPAAQGLGWGRRLLETLLDRLRQAGVPGVHLGVGKQNASAIGFYRRLGFVLLKAEERALVLGLRLVG